MRLVLRVLLCLLLAGPALARSPGGETHDLQQFAREIGLRDADGFIETVTALRREGRLPPRYMTKGGASRAGWRPGDDLCRVAPGRVIGGDRFGNRERRLPAAEGRIWYEADLDFNCGRRGARRLVWSNDGLIFVTVDHYESFKAVPR
jgi:hypothetical protein